MEEKKAIHEYRSESHEQEEEDGQKGAEIRESNHGAGNSSSSLHCSELSGRGREVSFNMGVGFGIIYLIAACKHELNKMVELSKQMETLLQHLKFTFQNTQKHHYNSSSSSSSSEEEEEEEEAHEHERRERSRLYSLQTVENSDIVQNNNCSSNLYLDMNTKGKGNNEKKMDQLEAELEVELEHLQQVQLDSEIMASCEYITEISVEDSAPHEESSNNENSELSFDEQKTLEFEYSKSDPNLNYYYYYYNNNGDTENNNNNNNNNNSNGVCPVELERKLHRLLEMRQEEKIKALESALDCAIRKLHQNQKELSWWKDTVTLVFHKISPH